MNYMVDGGTGGRPVFGTLEEANGFANEVLRETKEVLCVTETKRKATHTYKIK